jgi:hypothetical protein
LARDDIPCSIVTLQRAVLIPEDTDRLTERLYPNPSIGLMHNPFPKKKKKKKGKKGKKKAAKKK